MAYSKTIWVNGATPDISAANLNKIENGIFDVDKETISINRNLNAMSGLGTYGESTEDSLTQGTAYQKRDMVDNLWIPHGTVIYVKVKSSAVALVSLTANSTGGLNGDRTGRTVTNISRFNKWVAVTLSSTYLVAEYDPIIVALGLNISSANVTSDGSIQLEIAYGLNKEVYDLEENVDGLNDETKVLDLNVLPVKQKDENLSVSSSNVWQFIKYNFVKGQKYRIVTNVSDYNSEIVRIVTLSIETTTDKGSGNVVDVAYNNPLTTGVCEFTATENAKTLRTAVVSSTSHTITTSIETGLIKRVSDIEEYDIELDSRIDVTEELTTDYAEINVVPSYYDEQIEAALSKIHEIERNNGYGGVEYIFITDTHVADNWKKSPCLLKALLKNIASNYVIFGGDLVKNYGTTADMYEQAYLWRTLWEFACNGYYIFNIRGNHDITIRTSAQINEGITCAKTSVYSMLLSKNEKNFVLGEGSYPLYYYFDDTPKKVRYIILDSTERSPETEDYNQPWYNGIGISPTQLNWLISKVKELTEGWKVVICTHVGMTSNVLSGSDPTGYYQPVLDTIEAMTLKQAYSFNGSPTELPQYVYNISEDFSTLKADVLYVRNGHDHRDNYDYTGVWEIGSLADAHYPYADPFLDGERHNRTQGTIDEQALDVDIVDSNNGILYCNRIGSGYNRTFHLAPTGAGTLTPTISGSSFTWKSLNTDVCTVSSGVVSGISSGYTAVEAMSNDTGDKEMWAIHIS